MFCNSHEFVVSTNPPVHDFQGLKYYAKIHKIWHRFDVAYYLYFFQSGLTHDPGNVGKRKRNPTIKVNLGWLLYCTLKKTYLQVRAATGGGTRTVEFAREATYSDVILQAKVLFFPGGKHLAYIHNGLHFVKQSLQLTVFINLRK